MRVLVLGGGAREDALSWGLARSPSCSWLAACPGNAGTATRGENWDDIAVTNGKLIAARAMERGIDLVIIGPETAIAAGVGDRCRDAGLAVFGPDYAVGRLESSKVFAKRFMERYGIPTARHVIVHSLDGATKALDDWEGACVVKADGLAAGKGVVVCDDVGQARSVLARWYGADGIPGGGRDVVLEECLQGREVSVFAFGDGERFSIVGAACDYKRAGEDDTGPNTGGMGAYSPPIGFPADLEDAVSRNILEPVRAGLRAERRRFIGVLYCGLMWTSDGPRVVEFNVRFGDPEAQVIIPRLDGDLARGMHSAAAGAFDEKALRCGARACVGVVLATRDYPRSSTPLGGLPSDVSLGPDRAAFWGASRLRDGVVDAAGGRVLTVTALGEDVAGARVAAYDAVDGLARRFGDTPLTFRTDIALLEPALR